jgi:hypothetical protein
MSTAKGLVLSALALLVLGACSHAGNLGRSADAGDDVRIVPDDLTVMALPGGNGVLDLVALTLRKGPDHAELFAALKNEGDVPACDAALSVELFDEAQQSVAAGISALFTRHFYRLRDGSRTIAACAAPGDVTMAALTDLPVDIAMDDVRYVVYRCPYFALDVDPIAGLSIGPTRSVAMDAGTGYAGTLVNELDVKVSNPSVTVFPLDGVGRPLGVATASDKNVMLPGGEWAFETNPVESPATDYAAYPAGSFAN